MTHSLEESFDEPTLPRIPRVDVRQVLAGMQQQFAPISRESRLMALATIAAAYIEDDAGIGAEAVADEAARVLVALERFA